MPKKYFIQPFLGLVTDRASVKFHVQSDDYFGTIAMVLSLLEEQIEKDGIKNQAALEKTLKSLKKDLLFLQKNYQISGRQSYKDNHIKPKSQNKNSKPKGKLKSQ